MPTAPKSEAHWVVADDGCWVWLRAANSSGYGALFRDGQTRCAHRWLWEQINGPVPDGLQLDHLCRNRLCVNPGHLEVVSNAENSRRSPRCVGEESARQIRDLLAYGWTQSEVAAEYGITQSSVSAIRTGQSYGDAPFR